MVGCWEEAGKRPWSWTPVQVCCRRVKHRSLQLSALWAANACTGLWQTTCKPSSGNLEGTDLAPAFPRVLSAGWQTCFTRMSSKVNRTCIPCSSSKSGPFSYPPCRATAKQEATIQQLTPVSIPPLSLPAHPTASAGRHLKGNSGS